MNLGALGYVLAGGAGCIAGAVNAVAGGGTLVSFPALQALGLPPVRANVTNIIALTPGYAAGTYAQRADLTGQATALPLGAAAAAGGLVGSVLLIRTAAPEFRTVVPFLILFSCALLVVQDRLRTLVARRSEGRPPPGKSRRRGAARQVGVFFTSVYGGFFGAGLGIMLLAVLGLFSADSLPRLNALKQALSFVIGVVASAFLAFSGHVAWTFVAVIVPTSVIGGLAGGRVAHLVSPGLLRAVVVLLGLAVAIRYWV